MVIVPCFEQMRNNLNSGIWHVLVMEYYGAFKSEICPSSLHIYGDEPMHCESKRGDEQEEGRG